MTVYKSSASVRSKSQLVDAERTEFSEFKKRGVKHIVYSRCEPCATDLCALYIVLETIFKFVFPKKKKNQLKKNKKINKYR